jgi:hypothetical protein
LYYKFATSFVCCCCARLFFACFISQRYRSFDALAKDRSLVSVDDGKLVPCQCILMCLFSYFEWINGWMGGWIGWIDGLDGWMDGWMDVWMDEW